MNVTRCQKKSSAGADCWAGGAGSDGGDDGKSGIGAAEVAGDDPAPDDRLAEELGGIAPSPTSERARGNPSGQMSCRISMNDNPANRRARISKSGKGLLGSQCR